MARCEEEYFVYRENPDSLREKIEALSGAPPG